MPLRDAEDCWNSVHQVIGWNYDAAGNLTGWTADGGPQTAAYDALNRKVAQNSTSYAYNGDGVLVSDGTTTYVQDLAAPLSQVLTDGTANYVYGHDRLRALGGPWYVGDALGSVRQTLDDAGAVLATTNYDPWGTPQGTLSGPFGFTGEVQHRSAHAPADPRNRSRFINQVVHASNRSGTIPSGPLRCFATWISAVPCLSVSRLYNSSR